MKKTLPPVIIAISLLFAACGPLPPEKYFDTAVLSSNMLHGFANETDWRQFESPSVKLVGDNGQTAPMKRQEIVETKIHFIEEHMEELNDISETPETKDIIASSKELFQLALPVYKSEYVQLAKLYDQGASKDQTAAMQKSIEEKYGMKFGALHEKLISFGKVYAQKNNINVQWDIRTSPQF